jgi:predicted ATPase/DNA-binding SARP family transcriptional activator
MELRLLGPFEARINATPQLVAGHGERALLALFALSPGKIVATTTLIDALWNVGDLPRDPANALQLRVSKLRRTLINLGASERIHRDGAGYRLDADPGDVDAYRFARLIEGARRSGEAEQAIDAYDSALILWRGEPLVDFSGEAWTITEAARLTELRLAAVGERAERMLTLGRYEQVAADLQPIVAEVPTRERLVGQLMTALFNAGRQGEAVQVFTRTRRVLADELGIDPSRDLRAVMDQILRQDPAITPAPGAPAMRRQRTGGHQQPRQGGNLPLRSTSFVGRAAELRRIVDLLGNSRLVTLAGAGGAGKTALGIEAARAVADRFSDGAVFVRLAAVTEGEMLAPAVADALAVSIEGGTAAHRPRDVLIGHLRTRNTLLVLDNCEHLIEPVAALAETIMSRCAEVQIIATSREALAVPGEVQLPVAPLPVPAPGTPTGDIAAFASAELFLDRARAAAPGLVADAETLAAVGVICQRLDGIPLALELAAARLASLSPAELADRVRDRFALLTSGSRTADARQQTLRATVDWSHDLLTPPERLLFRRLAVFRGGWTLDAAEHVVADRELPPSAVLDLLDRLVRQSLVAADRAAGHTRYRMLETLRQYAAGELDRAADRDALLAAHARYYLALAEQAETGLRSSAQPQWTQTLNAEHANVRAALAWLTETDGHADEALRLAGSLGLYWHMGRHLEGRDTLRRVMSLSGGSPPARARAMQAVSLVERPRACIVHPSDQCAAAALNSLEIFESVGDRPRAAFSRLLLAVEGVGANPRHDAAALLAEADREFAALGDEWGQAVAAFVQMETLTKRGDEAGAQQYADKAIRLFRRLGGGWGLSAVLYHRGWGLARFGRHAEAVSVYQEAIDVANDAGVYNTVQWATADLGLTLLALGRVAEASTYFARAGQVSDQVGDDAGKVLATYGAAIIAQQNGDHASARPLFDSACGALERLGVPLAAGQALAGVASCDELAGDAAAARAGYQRLVTLGEDAGEVGLIATGLEGLARASIADSDAYQTARLLGRASWLRSTYDRPATPPEQTATSRAEASARAILGEQSYDTAARQGAETGLGAPS